MKYLIYSILLASVFTAISCTPVEVREDQYNQELVKLAGTFSKTNRVLALGDTLQLNITVPDTIAGTAGRIKVYSVQEGLVNMYIDKLDTVNRRGILLRPPNFWITRGGISNSGMVAYYMETATKPFGLTVNILPSERGIYMITILSQLGRLNINNNYRAKLLVDFDVPSRNIDLARPYLDDAWVNDALTRPQGTYVFKVE